MCAPIKVLWHLLEVIGLLTTSILLGIITFSVPFIQPIYLVNISGSKSAGIHVGPFSAGGSVSGDVLIGVFGYCLSNQESGGVTTRSTSGSNTSLSCKGQFPVNFGDIFSQVPFLGGVANDVSKVLTGFLLLHPIAFLFTILALIASVEKCRHRTCKVGLIWWAALIALSALIIDIIIVIVAKNHVPFSVQGGWLFFLILAFSTALLIVIGIGASLFINNEHTSRKRDGP